MKYKALRDAKFRAGPGDNKKVYDVKKGQIFEVVGGELKDVTLAEKIEDKKLKGDK